MMWTPRSIAAGAALVACLASVNQGLADSPLTGGYICGVETDSEAFDSLVSALDGTDASGTVATSLVPDGSEDAISTFEPDQTDIAFEITALHETAPPLSGEEVRAVLRLSDRKSGRPVSGQPVAAWMSLVRNAQVAAELPCPARVSLYRQGRVTNRPDVDLNASRLLILNRSGSISIVDPQVDFTITQMETVIPLPGVPADWTLSQDGRSLFVSLPIAAAVAVIDTGTMAVAALIEVGAGTVPTRVMALADGGLAVHLSEPGAVILLHPETAERSGLVPVGKGRVAFAEDRSGTLFVLASDGRLTAMRERDGSIKGLERIAAGKPSLAFSNWNRTLYAASDDSDEIAVFAGRTLARQEPIAVAAGLTSLAAIPGDRRLIALGRAANRLDVVDTAIGAVSHTLKTVADPVEVAFSAGYAYIRGLSADHFQILELNALRRGVPAPVDIQSSGGVVVPREALAEARLVAPYPGGALVANSDERQAYYYMEGMNAPMGTVPLYGPDVQGILTLERGFHETAPGTYETTTKLPKGGEYIAAAAVGPAGTPVCFPVSIAAGKGQDNFEDEHEGYAISLKSMQPDGMRQRIEIGLRRGEGDGSEAVEDLRIMAFLPSGAWQSRKWADPMDNGQYAAEWRFPRTGRYGIAVESRSLGIAFADQPPLYLEVEVPTSQAPAPKED